jgi:uncharacterized membrane protein YgcG
MKCIKAILILSIFTVMFWANAVFAEAESFVTRNFDVQMDLYENNSFVISEDIKVDFTEPRHGIFRYIPYNGTIIRQIDGETVIEKYRIIISDVKVLGHEYDTYRESGNLVIRIGSPDRYINGTQEYRISYRCTLYDDENTSFDSLYWNIIPQGWSTPIETVSMIINMPKPFNSDLAEFVAGRYGDTDIEAVNWSVNGTTITANTTRVLQTGEGVTLNILLPEGYFFGEKTTAWMYLVMMLLIITAPLLSILLWILFGRDHKIVKTVEFYPPGGVNSAELGYIIDGAVDNKDIISLIIYWANEGYLKIREEENKEFTLIKLKDLPQNSKTYEHTMFHGLFNNRETVALEDLKEDFYGTFEATKGQLKAHFTMRKENRIFIQSSIGARAIGLLLMLVPTISLSIFGFMLNKSNGAWVFLSFFAFIAAIIGFSSFITAYDKKDSLKKAQIAGLNLLGVITVFIFGAGIIFFSYVVLNNLLIGITVVLASLVSLTFTMRMKQRTKKSSKLLGRILGFKEFIRTAELDRIQRLVEENPSYFYNVLPYAYVFGLTDRWAKKFEGITVQPPAWYDSGYGGVYMFNTWVFMSSFNNYSRAIQQNISVPPAPSGGISGGGGGFSGGGMGGGGGGSW